MDPNRRVFRARPAGLAPRLPGVLIGLHVFFIASVLAIIYLGRVSFWKDLTSSNLDLRDRALITLFLHHPDHRRFLWIGFATFSNAAAAREPKWARWWRRGRS